MMRTSSFGAPCKWPEAGDERYKRGTFGPPEVDGRISGPTVIVGQCFDNKACVPEPEQPEKTALVWPRRGSLAVFDGGLGHGVLDSPSQEKRVTMLINWWTYQPQVTDFSP